MIHPAQALVTGAMVLGSEVIPLLAEHPYPMGTAATSALVMIFAAQEFDRAAARIHADNAAMRVLFSRAAGIVTDAGLASRLTSAAATRDDDISVSALMASNAALSANMIALQTALEGQAGADAAALRVDAWRLLREAAERRRLMLPPTAPVG